jgi:hypothetical protein
MIGKGKGEVKWEVPVKGMFYFFILNYSLSICYNFTPTLNYTGGGKIISKIILRLQFPGLLYMFLGLWNTQ